MQVLLDRNGTDAEHNAVIKHARVVWAQQFGAARSTPAQTRIDKGHKRGRRSSTEPWRAKRGRMIQTLLDSNTESGLGGAVEESDELTAEIGRAHV